MSTTTLNAEMKLGISSLPMDRASSCSSTKEAVQPQVFGQSLQKSLAWSSSACFEMYCQLYFHLKAARLMLVWATGTPCPWFLLVSFGVCGELLKQRVGLALWCFDAVRPHNAGRPVEIEHHH